MFWTLKSKDPKFVSLRIFAKINVNWFSNGRMHSLGFSDLISLVFSLFKLFKVFYWGGGFYQYIFNS